MKMEGRKIRNCGNRQREERKGAVGVMEGRKERERFV